jgi:hypothetical protein
MRMLTLTACVALLAAADGSALAASGCGKGMLWPYVRQPGDCLTDDEIKAGQRGVYSGPLNTNPDMSGVRVETPAQSTGVTQSTAPRPSAAAGTPQTAGSSGPAPVAPVAAPGGATLFGGQATTDGPALNGPGFSLPPAPRVAGDAPCVKGWLWPFVRNPGDCLTDAEKGSGQAGVFRAEDVVASATPAAGPGVTQVSAAGTSASSSTGAGAPSAAPACRKGWLWPFVRRAGDCPTDAERGRR